MMTQPKTTSLQEAAYVLDVLASGRSPDQAALRAAALALANIRTWLKFSRAGAADRDFLDAAAALKTLATGGTVKLDDAGRDRAALVADLKSRFVTLVPSSTRTPWAFNHFVSGSTMESY